MVVVVSLNVVCLMVGWLNQSLANIHGLMLHSRASHHFDCCLSFPPLHLKAGIVANASAVDQMKMMYVAIADKEWITLKMKVQQ